MKKLLLSFSFLLSLICAVSISAAQAQSGAMVAGSCGAPGVPCPQGSSGIALPNYTPNGGLPNWQACRAKVKAGTGSCTVIVMGDSTSTGHGAFFNTTANDARSGSWPVLLQALMGLPAANVAFSTYTVTGDNSIASYGAYDARTILNGWIEYSGAFVLGGGLWLNNDTTPITFDPSDTAAYPSAALVQTDSVDVYWIGGPSPVANLTLDTGTIATLGTVTGGSGYTNGTYNGVALTGGSGRRATANITVSGGAVSAVTLVSGGTGYNAANSLSAAASSIGGTGSGFSVPVATISAAFCTINMHTASTSFNKTTCTATLGTNIYNMRCSNATQGECTPLAWNAYNSAASRVSLFNAAADGSTIVNFATNTPAAYDPVASLSVYQPTLCIINSTINDAGAQTALATYETDLTYIVNGCKSNGADVLLMTGFPVGSTTSPLTVAQYEAAVVSVAASTNVPVWDSMAALGGANVAAWQALIPFGWNGVNNGGNADAAHWSIGLNSYVAQNVGTILQQ